MDLVVPLARKEQSGLSNKVDQVVHLARKEQIGLNSALGT